MLPLELLRRAAPSTPVRVMPPEDADTVTSPLPDWVMVMLPEPLLALVGPATAAAVMEPLPVLASRLAAPSTLMLPDPVAASTAAAHTPHRHAARAALHRGRPADGADGDAARTGASGELRVGWHRNLVADGDVPRDVIVGEPANPDDVALLLDGRVLLNLADARLDIAAAGPRAALQARGDAHGAGGARSTRIEPEPDETVRSTAPDTLSARSNAPSGPGQPRVRPRQMMPRSREPRPVAAGGAPGL